MTAPADPATGRPPAVSVVIPCYNLGAYLDEAVDSVLAQTTEDFDILVIDDGSTDEATRRLLDAYDRPKTRVLRTENRGLSATKNTGIAKTTGRYLCMLDADDRLDPRYMEASLAALEADPSLAFASHWLRYFGDQGGDWTPASCDFPALLDMNTVNGSALVRREAIEAVGGFDEAMTSGCEDWDLWITLVERGWRGTILPEVLFHYRRRADSMSREMIAAGRHPDLYRYIAAKHASAFRAHLPVLLARRERDIGTLRRHVTDLRLESYGWLDSELARHRDRVAVARRQVERARREREDRDERTRLRGELELATASRDAAVADAHAQHAAANRARDEADGLRHSLSWRLTAPLRLALDAARRLTGGHR